MGGGGGFGGTFRLFPLPRRIMVGMKGNITTDGKKTKSVLKIQHSGRNSGVAIWAGRS